MSDNDDELDAAKDRIKELEDELSETQDRVAELESALKDIDDYADDIRSIYLPGDREGHSCQLLDRLGFRRIGIERDDPACSHFKPKGGSDGN
jgi:predicted RNase H-like nuclease (RuvC/YqgF family)